jgi:hypothetical protein
LASQGLSPQTLPDPQEGKTIRRGVLGAKLYRLFYDLRNDFLHGNPITRSDLTYRGKLRSMALETISASIASMGRPVPPQSAGPPPNGAMRFGKANPTICTSQVRGLTGSGPSQGQRRVRNAPNEKGPALARRAS